MWVTWGGGGGGIVVKKSQIRSKIKYVLLNQGIPEMGPSAPSCSSSRTITDIHYFCHFAIFLLSISAMMRKLRRHKQQNNLNYKMIVCLPRCVPLPNNPACAAFTSTPERAHQMSNITVADVSEISASEHEIGRM